MMLTTVSRGGLKAFRNGDKQKSQALMRGRVLAQAFTLIAIGIGTYMGLKPHDRPANMEEKMERMNKPITDVSGK